MGEETSQASEVSWVLKANTPAHPVKMLPRIVHIRKEADKLALR